MGVNALLDNTIGANNTANGTNALSRNTTAKNNTATGSNALLANMTGANNTANGTNALSSNATASNNTATGSNALFLNVGADNTADGTGALANNTTGTRNTAEGLRALFNNTTGNGNIALGAGAGRSLTTGNDNICIGNGGRVDESNKIRIGTSSVHTATFIAGIRGVTVPSGSPVVVGPNDQLGTMTSSVRFKESIEPMAEASEAIHVLRPVTFRYKSDTTNTPQFGLIAEQVAEVNPDLVVRDKNGDIYAVRYDAVNAMLLNEFLKEHRTVEEQECRIQEQELTIAELQSRAASQEASIARQQKQIEALSAGLQKVSAQLELSKPAPQTAMDNQ
jgi:uncharacterized coiled-coil protein SlyX